MRRLPSVAILMFLLAGPHAMGQGSSSPSEARTGSVPIEQVIASFAKKSGKKFIVDPRVRGDVLLIGQDAAAVGYDELLNILSVHGFAAVDTGALVRVMPDAVVRQMPLQQISGKESRPDFEYVTRVIAAKNIPAPQLVPPLRVLMPQHALMAFIPCTNSIVVVDTFANTKRIEALIQSMDVGTPYEVKCEPMTTMQPAARMTPTPPRREEGSRTGSE